MVDSKTATPFKTFILKELKNLRMLALEDKIEDPFGGICYNLNITLEYSNKWFYLNKMQLIIDLADGWPHHSGMLAYPIEGDAVVHNYVKNKWEGVHLEKRLDLLEYMITKVSLKKENELEKYFHGE